MIRERTGRRAVHPLLGLFPLAVMSIATFLVVFSLMMARLSAGADPAVRSGAAVAVIASRGNTTVTTRTSGTAVRAGAIPAVSAGAAGTAAGALPLVVTRTSGAAHGGGGDD